MTNHRPILAGEIALRQHIVTILRDDTALRPFVDGVGDAAERSGAGRQLSISVPEARDWSGGGFVGREVQLLLRLQDDARSDNDLGAALNIIDAALQQAPRDLHGWCIVNVQPLARRILRGSDARWRALGRYRVRMMAQQTAL